MSKIADMLKEVDLGIDLDSKNQFKLLKAYFNARLLGDVKLYETRKGYHIKVKTRTNVFHRAGLGDDKDRLFLSELRGGDDVLFDYKDGRWVEELDDDWILRLPFWHFPRRKTR